MNGVQRRHRASVLLIVASALWWHRWLPALLLAGVVSWAVFHRWLEGNLGRALGSLWRRAWPPSSITLIALLLGGALAYWVASEPIRPKVLPIALNVVALSIILFGNWWTLFAREAESHCRSGWPDRCPAHDLARKRLEGTFTWRHIPARTAPE